MWKTFKYIYIHIYIKTKRFTILQEVIGLFNVRASKQLDSQINMLEQKTKHGNRSLLKKHIQNFQYDDSTTVTKKATKKKP